MVKDIVIFDDPRLRTPSKQVEDVSDPRIQQLIIDMKESMIAADGVGIAAPQIGENLAIFWVSYKTHTFVVVNPRVEILDVTEKTLEEGCLSFPNVFGKVVRAKRLRLTGINQFGKPVDMEAKNYLARVIQHEYDHLVGKVIVDKFVS
jgi:peptide deformylase